LSKVRRAYELLSARHSEEDPHYNCLEIELVRDKKRFIFLENNMMTSVSARHASEVKTGKRFEFGKNWHQFLLTLSDEKINLAEQSLQRFLDTEGLDGKTFLDIGSGSGLYSLVARRLGAHVRSFDFDSNSVACTKELRRRYFPNDDHWVVEQGSVLIRNSLPRLGSSTLSIRGAFCTTPERCGRRSTVSSSW
jgi:Ribosomal protein L11 methyltransferase (PrmA)